ncbi:hypothetical protein EON67_06195 [archaeon]|nr:MAG: hypothetical protein EON67_06195 [archaeon]
MGARVHACTHACAWAGVHDGGRERWDGSCCVPVERRAYRGCALRGVCTNKRTRHASPHFLHLLVCVCVCGWLPACLPACLCAVALSSCAVVRVRVRVCATMDAVQKVLASVLVGKLTVWDLAALLGLTLVSFCALRMLASLIASFVPRRSVKSYGKWAVVTGATDVRRARWRCHACALTRVCLPPPTHCARRTHDAACGGTGAEVVHECRALAKRTRLS